MQTKACGKRLLALVLAIVMVCSMLPVSVFAAEPDYELRVLTFEDDDYKGGTNFAGGTNWTSLIDEPQYGGKMLYGESGAGVDSVDAAYKWTDENNTWLSNTLSEGYGSWCYWSGGHAVSNYVSGEISTYGDFKSQLTVYKKDVTGLQRTGGGHNGSNNFAVHYGYADNSGYGLTEASLPTLTFADGKARVIDHMYVNNTDYALNCYIDGNGLTAKIGDDDWVKLIATGYNAAGKKTGTAEIYLCNGPKDIMMDWTKWDLSGLGKVTKVTFNVTGSSDNGYGFSQPAYFAYDDVAVRFEKTVPATGVTLDKSTLSLLTGETAALTATVQPENSTDTPTWTTGNEAVATVADGVVTAVGAGSTVITATCGSVKAECTVTVTASPLTITAGGKTCSLSHVGSEGETKYRTVLPYGSDVTINVAEASFLLVTDKKNNYLNDAGVNPFTLTAAELESALLTDKDAKPFTPAENSKVAYLSIMDAMAGTTYELYLELTREIIPATGVTLDQTELTLTAGKTAVLTTTVQPENTTDTVVWSSSKEEVATVENGTVTAKEAGETVITATCGSVKAECTVTVTAPVLAESVRLNKTEWSLYTGDQARLIATVSPENTTDKTIVWTSSQPDVATVENGIVTAHAAGTTTITAACSGNPTVKAECNVTVRNAQEPSQKDGVYQIGTAGELVWFAKAVSSGENAISAVLTNDIDLTDVIWTPIGGSTKSFAGSFDGANHTISNLHVDYATTASSERLYLGLFGQVEGTSEKHAVIQNLTVTGSVNAASEFSVYTGYVAGVVGSARYAELSNVISRVDVTVDEKVGNASSVGGLAGLMINTTITNCGNEGSVTGVKNLGGLCYELYSSTMTGCYNTGKITATGTYVGGLMGYAKQATITDAYSTGDVTTKKTLVGGLIGVMENSSLTNAYVSGKVTTAVDSGAIGAAFGRADQISNVYYLDGASAFGDESATAKTAEELKALAATLGSSFKENTGCGGYPLLAWQEARAHQYKDGVCTVCGAVDPRCPVLVDGVTDQTVTIQTGLSYQLDDLMDGKIFRDPSGAALTYQNYYYQKSSDGGESWGELTGFRTMEFGGIDKNLTNSVAGTYIYKFRAKNDAGYSADTWTLTLIVKDVVEENISFYVGRDQNYETTSIYPVLELYKTAGIDENQYDYVGWFTNAAGEKEYIYNPRDYKIIEGETNYVEIEGKQYELHDYEKIAFTNSAFDPADETATTSNTVVNNYNMFYATLETGRYSTRAYGWNAATEAYDIYLGGQSLPLPMEKDIYGGGGKDIYLGVVSCYATTKNASNEYFTENDYYVEMIMPVTGSMIHAGTPYKYTRYSSTYTAYPFLSYEAGNGSLYNVYAYPKDTEHYMFNQIINQTTRASYNVTTKNISIAEAMDLKITTPASANFGLYFQYNNFNTKQVTPYKTETNAAEETTTYSFRISKSNSNYTWRLTDTTGKYVTKAGWLASISTNTEKTITFADGAPADKKTHDASGLGTTVATRDEADIQVFLSHSGFLSTTETRRIRAYRMWELIDSDTANIMVEPEFHVQMLQGNAADVKQVNGGNAVGNWIDVKPTGTDIAAVTYDAIDMYSNRDVAGTHGGLFPANAPERTAVFVVSNEAAAKADAKITFNGGTETNRGSEWDYNYDTWYYLNTDTAPKLDFQVTGEATVSYAVVTTNAALQSTLSDWTQVTADASGYYHADLLAFRTAGTTGGTVIIRMTDTTGTSYRLVRVAEMSVTVTNASNSGEPIMPGDKVSLNFSGLYRGVNKVSGIFNPTTYYLRYSADEEEFSGTLSQYQQMNRVSVTLTVPEDLEFPEGEQKVSYMFTNGYTFGSMYSASSPFDTLYHMTDTGVGTNFSAVSVSFALNRLADVPVEVNKKVYYNVKLVAVDENGSVLEGLTASLKDGSNKSLTAEADGTYKLGYGTYTYEVEQTGFVRSIGSFKLGSADAEKVENGVLTIKLTVRKAAENGWDGKTTTEPKTDENGVYLIGTGAELAWFAQKVNSGSTEISGILTADIELAGYEWTPIGTASKNFAGTFDGRNHTVDNLSINYSTTTTQPLYRGLFGWVYGSPSKRVKIENLTVNGTVAAGSNKSVNDAYVGGIVGRADYADLTNLHSNVDVSIKRTTGNYWQSVGGVVGGAYYSLNVTNCSNSGSVTGWRYCAGIVGNISSGTQPSTITGCVNTGNVTAPSTCAAGIVSNLPNGCKVTACYNTGAIKAGGNYPAGIVGYCSNSEVRNCFNLGTITCNTSFTYGSVIGIVSSADAVIENLYYLEGTCEKGGIGSVKNEETQTAASVTAETLVTTNFLTALNAGLNEAAFKLGCVDGRHPLLVWETRWAHSFTTTPSDVLVSEATCTEPAVYYVKCDRCDEVSNTLTVKVGEPLGHDLTVTVVEPTCEKDGYTESVCARCGLSYRTNYVAAKGHSYVDVVTAPTCESVGYTTHTCSVCGDSYVDAIAPATGHSYADVVTAPTCEKGGYTTHTCSVCGSSYVDAMTEALGHDYQAVVTAPTCDAMGYTTHTCTRCGDTYVDSYTQAADHSYTSEVTKQPTCTEEGIRTFTCTNCGKSYTESIPMIAHSYEAVKTEPDCTHMGYTIYTCSACGDSYKADFVDATGHDCEATVIAPTCEGYGYTENHCKHCDYSYISEIRQPLGHDDKLTGAKAATCTESGYTGDMVCTRCGEVHSKGEELPALGHDFGAWTTVREADCFHNGLEERKCSRCGETEQRETTAETCPSEAYADLSRNGWYHEYVDWALKNGVMNGVGGGLFEPDGETTRAMLVMVLYRMAGAPDMTGHESGFADVSADSWYGAAVIWASENGIVNGVGGGLFDPDASLTREQMAMMLYRFAGYLGSDTEKRADLGAYDDANAVSAVAQDAMAWAVAEGLIHGRSAAELAPKAGATRAELATILFRFAALQNA